MIDQERRKRERVSVHFDVGIMLDGEIIQVQILNISLTGIFCTYHPLFRKDAACKVIISLSDNQQFTINSKILRVGEQGTAISFVEMDEESFVHLMWCSTMRVTQAASQEVPGKSPSDKSTNGSFPSESDKSSMLQAFGMPPDKVR
jgi:hypothetical protein